MRAHFYEGTFRYSPIINSHNLASALHSPHFHGELLVLACYNNEYPSYIIPSYTYSDSTGEYIKNVFTNIGLGTSRFSSGRHFVFFKKNCMLKEGNEIY